MKLYLTGHDYRSAVEQILLALFPGESVEFSEGRPEGDSRAVSHLSKKDGRLSSVTTLRRNGQSAEGSASMAYTEDEDEETVKRHCKRVIKQSFYRAAVKLLGEGPAWGALTGVRPVRIVTKHYMQGGTPESADRLLKNVYFVSPERRQLCLAAAEASMEAGLTVAPKDFSIYVGIPFCPTRCSYCSFVSQSVEKSSHLVEPYLDALCREIEAAGRLSGELGLDLKTLYIGGGTPTTLSAKQLERLMKCLDKNFCLGGLMEYTIEGGRPDTLALDKLTVMRDLGATRISVNPQTMIDAVLQNIGRSHSAADTVKAVELARQAGFADINMDLIAGLPGDTIEGFSYSLDSVIGLMPCNITVHTLALKRGSTLHAEGADISAVERVSKMLDYARLRLTESGYAPYYLYRQKFMAGSFENVGWCAPGCEGLYNIYAMEELHTIMALGAGAATKTVDPSTGLIRRFFNHKYPQEYIQDIDSLIAQKSRIAEAYR